MMHEQATASRWRCGIETTRKPWLMAINGRLACTQKLIKVVSPLPLDKVAGRQKVTTTRERPDADRLSRHTRSQDRSR